MRHSLLKQFGAVFDFLCLIYVGPQKTSFRSTKKRGQCFGMGTADTYVIRIAGTGATATHTRTLLPAKCGRTATMCLCIATWRSGRACRGPPNTRAAGQLGLVAMSRALPYLEFRYLLCSRSVFLSEFQPC